MKSIKERRINFTQIQNVCSSDKKVSIFTAHINLSVEVTSILNNIVAVSRHDDTSKCYGV